MVVSRRQRVNYEAQGGGRPALLEGVAVPVYLQDVDAVSKAVHQGAAHPLRAKEFGPLAEGQVEGNQESTSRVPLTATSNSSSAPFLGSGMKPFASIMTEDPGLGFRFHCSSPTRAYLACSSRCFMLTTGLRDVRVLRRLRCGCPRCSSGGNATLRTTGARIRATDISLVRLMPPLSRAKGLRPTRMRVAPSGSRW